MFLLRFFIGQQKALRKSLRSMPRFERTIPNRPTFFLTLLLVTRHGSMVTTPTSSNNHASGRRHRLPFQKEIVVKGSAVRICSNK